MNKQPVITIILIFLIFLTIKSIIQLESSKNRIKNVKNQIEESEAINKALSQKIEESTTDEYVEKLAIEKLNMTKDGYRIVIDNSNNSNNNNLQKQIESENLTNWEQWKSKFNL